MNLKKIGKGEMAFLIALIIGILFGLFDRFIPASSYSVFAWILIAIGIIAGVICWIYSDAKHIMTGGIAVLFVCWVGPNALIDAQTMMNILTRFSMIFAPLTIISIAKFIAQK